MSEGLKKVKRAGGDGMADDTDKKNKEQKSEEQKPLLQDNLVETKHSITLNGQTISYTVTTGTLVLKEEEEKEGAAEGEKPKASVFFIAYTRDEVDNPRARPITFSFNG